MFTIKKTQIIENCPVILTMNELLIQNINSGNGYYVMYCLFSLSHQKLENFNMLLSVVSHKNAQITMKPTCIIEMKYNAFCFRIGCYICHIYYLQ